MSQPATVDTELPRGEWDWNFTLSLLASGTRRHLLGELADSGGEAELDVLAQQLPSRDRSSTDMESLDRLSLDLYHTHVPKLADAGVVNWSADRRRVSLTQRALSHPILLPLARWSRSPVSLPSPAHPE
jgi:hypothetical protein